MKPRPFYGFRTMRAFKRWYRLNGFRPIQENVWTWEDAREWYTKNAAPLWVWQE